MIKNAYFIKSFGVKNMPLYDIIHMMVSHSREDLGIDID